MKRIRGRVRSRLLATLYEQDGGFCQLCEIEVMLMRDAIRLGFEVNEKAGDIYCRGVGVGIATIEHLKPLVIGGDYDPDNLILCCMNCNRQRNRKRNKMEVLWLYWVNDGAYYGTIMAKDVDKFKAKLERLCERERVSISTLWFREVKNASKSIFKTKYGPNKEERLKFAEGLINDGRVSVEKLGTVDPTEDKNIIKYLPIPEYGICLVQKLGLE